MADLETLQIQIKADADKAYKSINNLAVSLSNLSVSIAKIETGKLNDLASGLDNLVYSLKTAKQAVKTTDYTAIVKNFTTLSNIDTARLTNLAGTLDILGNSFINMTAANAANASVKDMASAIGKLGGVKVETAIANIPRLEQALAHLLTTFSRIPNINQSIIDFVNSLSNLAAQSSHIAPATRSIDNALESFGNTATRTTRKAKSLASIIGTLYAKFWLFMRGATALKNSFISAADYLEAFNYFDVTARKIGKDTFTKAGVGSAEQYAEAFTETLQEKLHKMSGLELDLEQRLIKTTNAKSLGLNLTELTQYQASIASITNAMGNSQEIAQSTAKAFSMLAGDMSSLKNLDFEQVSQNLQSALTGQARALYRYGIDLTSATLEQYAYANGITKSVSEMTQAEKAQLRLLAILDQSKVAWGDLANTINSPSNQLRMLQTNLKEVGTVFGQLFIPIMQSALPVLNGLSMAIKQLMIDIAELLGIKLDLDSFGTFGDEVDADLEAVEDLNSAIKETKKGIRDFDELKVINDSSKKNSGLGAEIDLTKQIVDATSEYEKVWDEAYERMRSKASEIAAYISGAFEPIKKIIEDFHIGDFFKAGEDVSALVASIFNFISEAINSVNWTELGNKIGEFIKGINWTEILKGIGNIIGSALQAALNLWQGMFDVAPFETALLAGFAILKFTGFGDIIKSGLSKALSKQIKAAGLSKEFSAALGKLGLISVGISLALTIDNVKSIKAGEYSPFSLKGLLKTMISSLFGGAGISLLASSIGIASGAFTFGIGAAISLLVTLAVTGAAMDTPYEAARKVWEEEYAWVDENNLDRMQIKTDIELHQGEIDTQFLQIDDLADKVYDLSLNYDKLTDGEKGLLKYYSDELIKVMPELANQIDTVTGAYKGTREELDKLIQKQKEQITVSAYQSNMAKLAEGISSAKYDKSELDFQKGVVNRQIDSIRDRFKSYMGEDFSEELWTYVLQSNMKENEGKILDYLAPDIDEYTKSKALRAVWDNMNGLGDLISALAHKEELEESLSATQSTLSDLEREYNYYADELGKILGEDVPEIIADANKTAADTQKQSKLPKAVKTTLDNVTQTVKTDGKASQTEMNTLFTKINNAFAGLGDGSVPAEVQKTMNNIKIAIIQGSPEIITLLEQLRLQMEGVFTDALYTKDGNLLWNANNISERLDKDFNKVEEALHANAKPGTKTLENDLLELFGVDAIDKLPESVNDGLKKLANTIEKGEGKQAVMDALESLESFTYLEAEKLGMYLERGTAGGIYEGKPYVKEATEDMVKDGFENTYMKTSESSSPSRLARRLAKYLPEGAALGIEDGIPTFESAVKNMVGVVSSMFGNVRYNVPDLGIGSVNSQRGFNYGSMDSNNGFVSQMLNMANTAAQNGQTEVVFRVEGDPYGIFKVVREENDKYRRQHSNRSAFN